MYNILIYLDCYSSDTGYEIYDLNLDNRFSLKALYDCKSFDFFLFSCYFRLENYMFFMTFLRNLSFFGLL